MAQENILRKACSSDMMSKAAQNTTTQLTQLITALNPTVQKVEILVGSTDCLTVSQ